MWKMSWGINQLFWDDFLINWVYFIEYYAALERLKSNKPTVLSKGSAINNDTVTLEVERKRSSIKKSRHAALIEIIELSVAQAGKNILSPAQRIEQAKSKTKAVKSDYEQLKEDYGKVQFFIAGKF